MEIQWALSWGARLAHSYRCSNNAAGNRSNAKRAISPCPPILASLSKTVTGADPSVIWRATPLTAACAFSFSPSTMWCVRPRASSSTAAIRWRRQAATSARSESGPGEIPVVHHGRANSPERCVWLTTEARAAVPRTAPCDPECGSRHSGQD